MYRFKVWGRIPFLVGRWLWHWREPIAFSLMVGLLVAMVSYALPSLWVAILLLFSITMNLMVVTIR
jgi:hypothetical protein